MKQKPSRIILAITGATGACYGVQLLKRLNEIKNIQTHLVISNAAKKTLKQELALSPKDLKPLADKTYDVKDIAAPIASGSFQTLGMIVAPCSMKTLSAIAHAYDDNLITRAADVTLKERRRLVLLTRETPLTLTHLRNMTAITEMGGIIYPPQPPFYLKNITRKQMIDQSIYRVLTYFGISHPKQIEWDGS